VFELIGLLMRELLAGGTSLIAEGNFNSTTLFENLPEARLVQVHIRAASIDTTIWPDLDEVVATIGAGAQAPVSLA
jgi:hypothetical protein